MLTISIQFSAETLGAPEQYVSVYLDDNKPLTFSGTLDPAFQLSIVRFELSSSDDIRSESRRLTMFLTGQLEQPESRSKPAAFKGFLRLPREEIGGT